MAEVDVEINSRTYKVACDDGQEEHLTRLGSYVNSRMKELIASVGQIGDASLLVMVSLLIADELSEAYAELEMMNSASNGVSAIVRSEEILCEKIESLAEQVETITNDFLIKN